MKKLILFFSSLCLLVTISGCSDDPVSDQETDTNLISGVAQKGPFISGSNITLYELKETSLTQTGSSFYTQIQNNEGRFEYGDLSLDTPYASFRVDGYYYNEVLGEQSEAQITLRGIEKISGENSFNINIISHLAKPRIEYLVTNEGLEFSQAKSQAYSEILDLFHIDIASMAANELDISKAGEHNAALLAISSILQGYRSNAELTEFLSYLTSDLKEDGELDDAELGSELKNHALFLNSSAIKNNLEQRYETLGITAEVPDFNQYLTSFIENAPFEVTDRMISYPESGQYGANILSPDITKYYLPGNNHHVSLAAETKEGIPLKIKLTSLVEPESWNEGGMWMYTVAPAAPKNWEVFSYNYSEHTQEFVVLEPGKLSDMQMFFYPGRFLVEYFELAVEKPLWSKEFVVVN